MISIKTSLPDDLSILTMMEKEHPIQLRWDMDDKIYYYTDPSYKFFYMYVDDVCVGELILELHSSEAHVVSITILSEHHGCGYGHCLVGEGIKWCKSHGYKWIVGEAKQPVSIGLFLKNGAVITGVSKNHGDTGLDYVEFEIKI